MNLKEVLKSKRKLNRLNNQGSAIVLVIIAMALVGILSTMILWMSYMNYLMKITDKKSTNSFYSAEQVVEQIKVGIQDKASDAMIDAYENTMANYSLFDNSDQRQAYFESEMKKNLLAIFAAAGSSVNYDFDLITGCIDSSINYGTGRFDGSQTTPYVFVRSVNPGKASDFSAAHDPGEAWLIESVSDNSIALKNIDVVYYDKDKNVSAIHTDLRLEVPRLHFEDVHSDAQFADYSIVANEQLVSSGASGTTTFNGSVYGGNGGLDDESMIIGDNIEWDFATGETVACGKTVSLGKESKLKMNYDEFWSDNIALNGDNGEISLEAPGKTYVRDDLTVWKRYCNVFVKGAYYGFGTGNRGVDDGSDSSSIIINGRDTNLDISTATDMWIGGRSYIGTVNDTKTYTSPISTVTNVNIPMSESIAIRGNQVAYLVPPAAICRLNGNSLVRSNPITAEEYTKYVTANEGNPDFAECDLSGTLLPGTDNYLSDFTPDPDKGWKRIVARGHNGTTNLVYYYMNLDPAMANEYFEKYYGVERNKDIIDQCLKYYSKEGIQVSNEADVRIEMAGNWLSYDKAADTVSLNKASVVSNEATLNMTYENKFEALNAKLVPDKSILTAVELSRSVYENLIDEVALNKYVAAGGSKTFKYEKDGTELNAVVYNGDCTVPSDTTVRLVICAGNATINSNFKGIVIAKNKIYVSSGVTIESAPDDVRAVLNAKNGDLKVYSMFLGGSSYATDEGDEGTTSESRDINDLVIYENWSKQ